MRMMLPAAPTENALLPPGHDAREQCRIPAVQYSVFCAADLPNAPYLAGIR
jgi:hypothetical protein